MNVLDRLQRSIANRHDEVFLRADFESFASQAQVGRALKVLTTSGVLVKLGVGVYAKAKPSVLSGLPIPVKPLEVLAPRVLEKLGVPVEASRLTTAYNEGHSTQLPAGIVLNTGRRRIRRKLGFNGRSVQYEQA